MDPLLRALVTAGSVAALLLLARHAGGRLAGLVTGLPIVTAPALAWLALDRGAAFAGAAAAGCVAAGAVCALFGLGYAWACRRAGPLPALAAGLLLAGLPLPLWWAGNLRPEAVALLSLAACALGAASLRRADAGAPPPRRVGLGEGVLVSAAVAGLVSALVSRHAGAIGAFWSGLWASAPLVAAVVAVRLHRDAGGPAVAPYLQAYLGGLMARTCLALAVVRLAGA